MEPPQLIRGEAGEEAPQTVKKSAGQGNSPRPDLVKPKATKEGSHAEDKNGYGEGQCDLRNTPVKLLDQRPTKDAPGIHRAERHLQQDTCRGDTPSVYP